MISKKSLILGAVSFLFAGLAISQVPGTNWQPGSALPGQIRSDLLVTESASVLSADQALKIYSDLNFMVATPYKAGRRDWLEKLARELKISAASLRSTNNLDDTSLRPSQEILLQNRGGMIHISKQDEPLDQIIKTYDKLGSNRAKILAQNDWDEMSYLKDGFVYVRQGSKLWIPDARRSFPFLVRPVNFSRISSYYGVRRHPVLKTSRRHDGYDMVAPYGAPVYAGQTGVVTYAGWMGGYGNLIEIRHSQITTRYGHLSQINVAVGQRVRRKQLIGRVGSTGLSTGPHLHFEVRKNSTGKPVRPGQYL